MPAPRRLTAAQIAAALNEWMRQYVNDPTGFEREFETVSRFRQDWHARGAGAQRYGIESAAFIFHLHDRLQPKPAKRKRIAPRRR